MRGLRVACSFLTRLPTANHLEFDAGDVGRSTPWFPVVGALVGTVSAVVVWLAYALWPSEPLLCGLVATGVTVLFTGGLHQDALADVADGMGGGHDRESSLTIMRDSQIGTFGGLALVLSIGLRVTALASLVHQGISLLWVVGAACLARWSAVALARALPYARTSEAGLGRAVTDYVGWREMVFAGGVAVAGAYCCFDGYHGLALVLCVAITWLTGSWFRRRLGGITGDGLGFVVEANEIAILLLGTAVGVSR